MVRPWKRTFIFEDLHGLSLLGVYNCFRSISSPFKSCRCWWYLLLLLRLNCLFMPIISARHLDTLLASPCVHLCCNCCCSRSVEQWACRSPEGWGRQELWSESLRCVVLAVERSQLEWCPVDVEARSSWPLPIANPSLSNAGYREQWRNLRALHLGCVVQSRPRVWVDRWG